MVPVKGLRFRAYGLGFTIMVSVKGFRVTG
jgi:hypothetical protein